MPAKTNVAQVEKSLQRFGDRFKARARVVFQESMDRLYQTSQELCPVDTGFMKLLEQKDLTEDGLGYAVGWYSNHFELAGKPFYPVFVVLGTRLQAAQDCLFAPAAIERRRLMRDLIDAVKAA